MSTKKNIKLRYKRFADEYIRTGNAEISAVMVGYSERYARGNAYKLLEYPDIREYIDERMKEIEDGSIANSKEILQYLTQIARGESTEKLADGTDIPISIKDRIKACELLGKRYGLFKETIEVSKQEESPKLKEIMRQLAPWNPFE